MSVLQSSLFRHQVRPQSPFDKSPPNIVFRCGDLTLIPLHSDILAHISPYFQSMFQLPQSPPTSDDSAESTLPIIDIVEDHVTVRRLMMYGYPGRMPAFESLEMSERLIRFADKYDAADIMDTLVEQLPKTREYSLGVYGLAVRCGFEQVASEAALRFKTGYQWVKAADVDDAENYVWEYTAADRSFTPNISAGAYHRLVRFILGAPVAAFIHPPSHTRSDAEQDQNGTVPPPYVNADLIVRSTEGGDFPVHSAILSLSSPILEKKVKDALAAALNLTQRDTLPVMEIGQPTSILTLLLAFVHPSGCAVLPDDQLSKASALLQAAFTLQISKIIDMSSQILKRLAEKTPLQAYLVSVILGKEKDVRYCATRCAQENTRYYPSTLGATPPEMEDVLADYYYPLLKYCFEYRAAVRKVSRSKLPELDKRRVQGVSRWWSGDLSRDVAEVTEACMLRMGIGLSGNGSFPSSTIERYCQDTAKALREATSQVQLKLPWEQIRASGLSSQ
ncbi:unnamed protein product [Somion occarium]|uniref:BTB domain-containing protein n=1 Tax=Somion occarium TaxID=3059160 RepID=A0ABP1CQ28_9APHY